MKKLAIALLALFLSVPAFAEDKEGGPVLLALPPGGTNQVLGWSGSAVEWENFIGNVTLSRTSAGNYTATVGGDISVNSIVVGPATGGSKGPGTINISGGLYVNGVLFNSLPTCTANGIQHDNGSGVNVCNSTLTNVTFAGMAQFPDGSYWNSGGVDIKTNLDINTGATLTFNAIPLGGTCGGGQFVNVISATGVPTCATPAGGAALPSGVVGQFVGYPATGTTGEAETLSGDATFTRAGANSYTIAVTKTGGVAFTGLATASIPLSVANGGTGSSTAPTTGKILVASSATVFAPVAMSQDCTIVAAGTITCTKTNNVAFSALATAAVPLSVANGGNGSSTAPTTGQIEVAQSASAYGPVTMSGDATITSAGAITVTKSSGTALTSLFAPLTNPAGGQNNYAPLANPTFTGTVTMPDASTITSAGYNSIARLGIGIAAPTGQYYLQVSSANTSAGTYVNILNTAAAGAAKIRTANDTGAALSFGSLGSANPTAPDEGGPGTQEMFADSNISFLVSPANGIVRFVNNAGSGSGPLILTVGGTGGGGGGLTVGAPTGGDKGIGTVNATNYYINGTALSGLYAPLNLAGVTSSVGFNFGGLVGSNYIAAYTCVVSMTVPTNFANAKATCGTNPAESDAYTVKVNGVVLGTITLSTSCVPTLGAATQTTCSAGQRMEVDAPATVSGQDVAITLAVTR